VGGLAISQPPTLFCVFSVMQLSDVLLLLVLIINLISLHWVRGQLNIYIQQTLPKDRPDGSIPDGGEVRLYSAVH